MPITHYEICIVWM